MILNVELDPNSLSSLEDIYEEMILERSAADLVPSAMPERVHYDKVPKVFTTLEAWPRRTNLRCWSCDFNFESRPVFVPMDIKGELRLHRDPGARQHVLFPLRGAVYYVQLTRATSGGSCSSISSFCSRSSAGAT